MITLNVFFQVNPAKRQAFLSLLNTMVQESNKEAGCSFTSFGNARAMRTATR